MHLDALIAAISRLWRPGNFRVGGDLRCAWQFETTQSVPWELFRGRLVDDARNPARFFIAWNLLPVDAGKVAEDPLVSVLFDEGDGQVHVTRGYLVYAHETDAALETREVRRWMRELVGSLSVGDYDEPGLVAEIRTLIHHAVVGTSRLPLTSVEAPHPAFTLGELAYVPRTFRADESPDRPLRHGSEIPIAGTEFPSRALEAKLRAGADDLERGDEFLPLVRSMFNDISLSPYTDFVDVALDTLLPLFSEAEKLDLLGTLIRQLGRHLTAYDLVLFHHRGANFPDALFLDALLSRFLELAVRSPNLLEMPICGAMRRRALRQGLLLRRRYEGHAVPDAPTSPGENARVLPEPYCRVPDEQIEHPGRRRRLLFAEKPTRDLIPDSLGPMFAKAFVDLAEPAERRELGMALFIDRPLGYFKQPAEVDATPLLSYEAYSETLAAARLREVERLVSEIGVREAWSDTPGKPGAIWQKHALGLDRIPESLRPAVSLADARRVAGDFRILRTTRSSAAAFWRSFDVADLPVGDWPLVARVIVGPGVTRMIAYDAAGEVGLDFDIDPSAGFMLRGGVEVPRAGLVAASGRRIGVH